MRYRRFQAETDSGSNGLRELLVEGEVWDFVPPGFLAVTIQSQDRFAA